MECLTCSKPLLKRWQRKYCSKSCAARRNNRLFPKRQISSEKICICGGKKEKKAELCRMCRTKIKEKRTLFDVMLDYPGAQKWNQVRKEARLLMIRWGIPKSCMNCGWDKHVEVIHIRAISSFPLDILVIEVNKRGNLMYLCPNCHWVFDNMTDSSIGRTVDSQSTKSGSLPLSVTS